MITKMATCAIVLLGLTACGSSGNNGNAAFNDGTADHAALFAAVNSEAVTPTADMPTSGAGIFRGFAKIDRKDPVLADMSMIVDFGNGSVSGRMDNFQAKSGTDFPSGVDIFGRVDGNGLTATGIGAPDTRNGLNGSLPNVMTVDIAGKFRGDNAYNAAGTLAVKESATQETSKGTFAVSQYPGYALPGFPPPAGLPGGPVPVR